MRKAPISLQDPETKTKHQGEDRTDLAVLAFVCARV